MAVEMRRGSTAAAESGPAAGEAGSRKVVYAALLGNLAIAVTKGVAALVTGSSAMFSEAVHSCVDTGNEFLLLYGMRRARRRPDIVHPLGYGRELYFWSFIVALLVFAVGAGVSVYQGLMHLRSPEPIESPFVSYAVLVLSFVFEGASWRIALREFRASKGERSYWEAIRRSKDPPQFMVLLEDSAALLGLLFAFAGTIASQLLGDPRFDGIASLAIGALLAVVAVLLARESKGLLIGERADPVVSEEIARLAGSIGGITQVNGVLTTQLSPAQVVAAVSLEFEETLAITDVERIVADLEAAVRRARPEVTALFVKPQPNSQFQAAQARRHGVA